ncbi:MAG: hypothetical protein GWN86_08485, partial [Desulfobacterales bacterium]|nr:hypothetical protein [Desulfobacterales bacterium]
MEISQFDLSVDYQRLPYPLQVKGDQFTYDDNTISLGNVNLAMGKSSVSEFNGRFEWEKTVYFEIRAGKSYISLTQIHPWLQSFKTLGDQLKDLGRIKGGFTLFSLNMKGPLLEPKSWFLEMKGAFSEVAIDTSLFPGPVRINRGSFEAFEELRTQKILFRDAQISMLDARFKVSGSVHNHLKGIDRVDLVLDGKMGPQVNSWVSKEINMPAELTLRSPLSVSKVHVAWDKDSRTAFTGDLVIQNGPKLSLDIIQRSHELKLNKLHLQDKDSNASLALDIQEREFSLKFTGNIAATTRERLFVKSEFPKGWL